MVPALVATIVTAALSLSVASAAEIKVISANALADVIVDSKGKFESDSRQRLTVNVVPTGEVLRRVLGGESFDVVIGPREALDELEKKGQIEPGSAVTLTLVNFGLAVASDGPRPDVSTPEALKNTLLTAKTVLITDPTTGGISGVHFMEVVNKLGIANQMKDKIVVQPGDDYHARHVVQGTADLAVQAEHEIRCIKGATFLDYPAVFQKTVVFTGAVGKGTAELVAAKSYLSFLTSAGTANTFRAHCLRQRAG